MRKSRPWLIVRDGETEEEKKAREAEAARKAAAGGDKQFTQADMDAAIAKRLSRQSKQNEDTVKELKALQASAKLTSQERDDLAARIEKLETAHLTDKEVADRDKRKLKEESIKALDAANAETKKWQTRFQDSTISQALTNAAVAAEAFNPGQVVSLMKLNSTLVEGEDAEGQPNGKFGVKVKVTTKNDKDETVDLVLSPEKALETMKEMPDCGNLFKSGVTAGTGSGTAGGAGAADSAPPKDSAGYAKWREKHTLDEVKAT